MWNIFCQFCGKQLPDTDSFCQYCGKPVEAQDMKQPGYVQQMNYSQPQGYGYGNPGMGSMPPKKKQPWWLVTVIGVIVVLAVAAVLIFGNFNSGRPEDTVQKMEDALNELNMDALMECCDEQTQSLISGSMGVGSELAGIDLESLSQLGSGLGGLMSGIGLTPEFELNVTEVEYSESDRNTCMVTIDFAMSYQGETESQTMTVPMIKEEGEWLLSLSNLDDFY